MKKIIKELIPYVVIVVVVVLFRTFIATPVIVDGSSMDPTLRDNQLLILNKLSKNYDRFDIVVVDATINGNKERLVKRIIGLPGDKIEYKHDKLYVNDKEMQDDFASITDRFNLEDLYGIKKLPKDSYFVMGDNRKHSLDSRDERVGIVAKSDIVGKAIFRIFPFD